MNAEGVRFAAALALVWWAGAAGAQTRDAAGAEWLFREGRTLMKEGDLAAACPKLAESLRFDPAVGTLMNLAECEERLGHTASAWQRWGAAADQLPAGDRRRSTALAKARALEALLPRLTVQVKAEVPGLVVVRDGLALGAASIGVPLPVDPGRHRIVASAPGHTPRSYEVTVESGGQQVVVVEPVPPPTVVAAPVPTETLRQAPPPPERPRGRAIGWGLLAGGGLALGTGTYFGLQALAARREARDDCQAATHRCWSSAAGALERDRRASLVADVAFAAGTLATAGGLYLLLRRAPVVARPAALPGGGGMELAGRF